MKKSVKSIVLKIVAWLIGSVAGILLLLFLAPIVFPGTVAEQIKSFTNHKLDGEVNFDKSRLSFFEHFPSLTLTLYDFSLKGSAPFREDTLIAAKEVAFGINLKRLIFNNEVKIDKLYILNGKVDVKVNELGEANYNVYISDDKKPADTTSTTAIKLEKIDIRQTYIKYDDLSAKMLMEAKGFNYIGTGDLSEDVFDLATNAQIDSLNFTYDKKMYMLNKKVSADLITRINTNSLSFTFQKNNLMINKLPVKFNGKLNILKDGYDIDVAVSAVKSNINDLFAAMPPEYVDWLAQSEVKGTTDLLFTLKGNYNAAKHTKPDMRLNMKVREGYLAYQKAPFPVSNLKFNFDLQMPSLNTEQMIITLDSLSLNLGKDKMVADVHVKGLDTPQINAKAKGTLDLGALDRALGIENLDIQGILDLDVVSKGEYNKEKRLFPVTNAKVVLHKGMIKTQYYPNPITDIEFVANTTNTTGDFKDVKINFTPASFVLEENALHVNAVISNFDDIDYNVNVKGDVDVAKLYKVFSQKGLDFNGYIKANLTMIGRQSYAARGQYSKMQNKGTLILRDIKTTSEYFPKPFVINEGVFAFKQDKMWFKKFKAVYGQSDFAMNGYLQNVINYVFAKNATLKGSFNVKSQYINVDEFMALESGENEKLTPEIEKAKTTNAKVSGVVVLPTNLNVTLVADAKKVDYNGLKLDNLNGKLYLNNGKLALKQTVFNLIGCSVAMDANYDDLSAVKALFDFHLVAKDFDVKRAYNEIPMFRTMVTAAEKAEGIISVDYTLKGAIDGNMKPIYPSLDGSGLLSVNKVKINGLKMFSVISEKTGSDGINNPDVSQVDIKTAIKNNIITIERFKMKVAGFRPRLEGQTSLDGKLNLRMRLGLPPLGILGIPIVITGTQDKPKIKIFSKSSEDIEETEYVEDKK
ncbi:AsmA-like C-terminal region-containing protein [Flavobacterium sp. '19STA2R22 D10 B1']|uniref:AsmA-like C-terminal region-containing protein n=1 Tax=Flavobacterium aerium TaxID=3037261 RepID=UPI00278BE2FE|nr:AsmA-like C-terminal region-containing protein [Flavobacterium sp. '19STA2R22 D10 B1']